MAPLLGVALAVAWPASAARKVTLAEALALATEQSPLVEQGQARLAEARADATAARASFFPKISASAAYSWLDPDRLSPLGAASPSMPTLYGREGLAVARGKQVLFDGLKSWEATAAADRGVAAEEIGARTAGADAQLAVTQAFVRLLSAQNLTAVAEQSLARQRLFEGQIAEQLEVGKGARLDLLRAQAQRLEAERALVAAREGQKLAAALLSRAIGLDGAEELAAEGELGVETEESVPSPSQARRTNPDLRRTELLLEQSQSLAGVSRGGFLPELSLQGSYGYRSRDVGGSADEWTAGVFLDWALFDGLATRAQVSKSEARLAQVRATRRALELQVDSDVQEALANLRTAVAAARSTEKTIAVAREAAEAAAALYEVGRATGLDVLTAQAELARAEAALVLARGDAAVAKARLARLLGQ
jgi:outer membrane protein